MRYLLLGMLVGVIVTLCVYHPVTLTSTYDDALIECSQYKNMNERNSCRMHVTELYKKYNKLQ